MLAFRYKYPSPKKQSARGVWCKEGISWQASVYVNYEGNIYLCSSVIHKGTVSVKNGERKDVKILMYVTVSGAMV